MKPFFVTVTDPLGAVSEAGPVPINTRMLLDGPAVIGDHNLQRKFSRPEWLRLIQAVRLGASGQFGRFTWERS